MRDRARARAAWSLAVGLPILLSGCAGSEQEHEPWVSLVETERQFAAVSEEYGMKVAFLRFLHDESILFRPHPVNGKRHTEQQPESGVRLSWAPGRAHVALAGDVGWTTGPFRVEPVEGGQLPTLGHFVSVWKRQANGRWKVMVDLGTVNPDGRDCAEPESLRPSRGPGPAPGEPATETTLLDLERAFAERSKTDGVVAAYEAMVAPTVRLYRDRACPAGDAEAAMELLRARTRSMHWEPTEARISSSDDLAYTIGSYETSGADGPLETGHYVRVWHRDADGAWKLAVDVTSPVPPSSP